MPWDPFGARPVFYAETAHGIRTAPSPRRLLREADLPRALEPVAAAAALCGVRDPGASLFRHVKVVPPGHELVESATGVQVRRRWAPLVYRGDGEAITLQEAGTELLRRLRESVRAHRRAEGPTACALSGGIDSGALLALLVEAGGPVQAFMLADDFAEDGDRDRARSLAATFGIEPALVPISEEELPGQAAEAVRACEDLLWNGRAVALHRFYLRLAEKGATRVLSGAGADEVLCGHPDGLLSFTGRLRAEHDLARSLLRTEAAVDVPEWPPAPSGVDTLIWRQHLYLTTVLRDSTLPPECRLSADAGIDVRLPYLDLSVAEFSLRLPPTLRASGSTGKIALREALRGVIPEAIRARPKTARLAPAGGRTTRARAGWLAFYEEWLSRPRLEALEIVEPERVRALLDDFRARIPEDPARAAEDAVLMRVASLAILLESDRLAPDQPQGCR